MGALCAQEAAPTAVAKPTPTSVTRTGRAALMCHVSAYLSCSPQGCAHSFSAKGRALQDLQTLQRHARHWAVPIYSAVPRTWAACLPVFSVLNALEAEGALVRQHDASRDQPLVPRHQNGVQHALIEQEVPHPLQGMWQLSAPAEGSIMTAAWMHRVLFCKAALKTGMHAILNEEGVAHLLLTWWAAQWHCERCYRAIAQPSNTSCHTHNSKRVREAQVRSHRKTATPSAALPALGQLTELLRASSTKKHEAPAALGA